LAQELVVQGEQRYEMTVHDLKKRVDMVQQAMGAVMRPEVHYGMIPGCKKPSLWKPGSELLLSMFRISVIPRIDDLSSGGEVRYRVTCQGVIPNGDIVGEGIGECSSEEEKYKWRGAICNAEYEDTADDRRRKKYTRDGGKYNQVRMNPADVANTILKMAKKRAQMDLTLTCTGASDVFTQDLEDLPAEYVTELEGEGPKEKAATRSASVKPAQTEKVIEGEQEPACEETTKNPLDEEITETLAALTNGVYEDMETMLRKASHYTDTATKKDFEFGLERLVATSAKWKTKAVQKLRKWKGEADALKAEIGAEPVAE